MDGTPRIFISYSHDDEAHREKVVSLAERLRKDGLETRIDQSVNGTPAEGWPRWMLDELDAADFVLVVCAETYWAGQDLTPTCASRIMKQWAAPGSGNNEAFELTVPSV